MSPEDAHKPIRIYTGGLILGVNYTLYDTFIMFPDPVAIGMRRYRVDIAGLVVVAAWQ